MAMPQTRVELNQIIEEQVGLASGEPQIVSIGKLPESFSKFDELSASFTGVKTELEVIKSQVEGVLPQLERAAQTSLSDLEKRAGAAHEGLTTSIGALESRDREISDKLKDTFQTIDTQLKAVQLQASTVTSMQEGIHSVVVKQQQEMERVRLDVERYVANAIATITSNTQSSQSPVEQQGQGQRGGDGGRGQLNDPRKCEVDPLTLPGGVPRLRDGRHHLPQEGSASPGLAEGDGQSA